MQPLLNLLHCVYINFPHIVCLQSDGFFTFKSISRKADLAEELPDMEEERNFEESPPFIKY
jgi:hypothetical protein